MAFKKIYFHKLVYATLSFWNFLSFQQNLWIRIFILYWKFPNHTNGRNKYKSLSKWATVTIWWIWILSSFHEYQFINKKLFDVLKVFFQRVLWIWYKHSYKHSCSTVGGPPPHVCNNSSKMSRYGFGHCLLASSNLSTLDLRINVPVTY